MDICLPLAVINGTTSIHLVKYFVAVIIHLWPLEDGGLIAPIRLSPHRLNGKVVIKGCNSCASASI